MMLYHRNRLIKTYEKVGYQKSVSVVISEKFFCILSFFFFLGGGGGGGGGIVNEILMFGVKNVVDLVILI